MPHPYSDLAAERFWRTGVADLDPLAISKLWIPKFRIRPRSKIVTAGSCFAQHFSRALVARGYGWQDFEPGPIGLDPEVAKTFNYGVFSFRTGNIYTPKMLLQWLSWAFGDLPEPDEIWQDGARFFDPYRPAIEPNGFASADEVFASRAVTLAAIRAAVRQSHVFVFTMGLTESWANAHTGVEYAVCPGTIAGHFDAAQDVFVNHRYAGLLADLQAAVAILRRENPQISVLLTVSPVPLTATASEAHVLLATSHSKSLLRAVASEASDWGDYIDYFPSYEMITSPVYRGMFFAPNLRSVLPHGVDHVMDRFFRDQAARFARDASDVSTPAAPAPAADHHEPDEAAELACEEAILHAFAPQNVGPAK
jgi:hypothetical protein